MRLILLTFSIVFVLSSAAVAAPSLFAQEGKWVCLPDDSLAPQVLIDFEENVYRRCDQNTCSLYDILDVQRQAAGTVVSFAPGASLVVPNSGGRYTESLTLGASKITSTGECSFQNIEPEPS